MVVDPGLVADHIGPDVKLAYKARMGYERSSRRRTKSGRNGRPGLALVGSKEGNCDLDKSVLTELSSPKLCQRAEVVVGRRDNPAPNGAVSYSAIEGRCSLL